MMKPRSFLVAALLAAVLVPVLILGGAVTLESHDPFCASCHTQPEVEYFERSLAAASDLASSHAQSEIRCIDCHSGEGPLGRTISLRQGAADLAAYVSGSYLQPALTTSPLGEIGCTKCHNPPSSRGKFARTEGGVTSSHYHFSEYAGEWLGREPDPSGTCAACHEAHTQGTLASQVFVLNEAVNLACDACHAALSGWVPPTR